MAREYYTTVDKLLSVLRNKDLKSDFRVSIIDGQALSIGPASSPQAHVFDFESEALRTSVETSPKKLIARISRFDDRDLPAARAQRTTGHYTFTHKEKDVAFARNSLADLLEAVLVYLELLAPGTLEKLSATKKRTRRIVARDKRSLYDKSHLRVNFAREISGGWWMGTNNSGSTTKTWIRQACDAAGIDTVSDVVIGI